MPFVDAVWNGQCADRKIQQELCEQLLRVSELSRQKSSLILGEPSTPVLYDDPDQEAEYLVCESVFSDRVPTTKLKKVENGIYLATKLGLYGVELPLFDPQVSTPPFSMGTNDRMSFVFTRSCEPELDGLLVQAFPVSSQHTLSELCSQVLDIPALEVRNNQAALAKGLLGWVKHFFIPDLNYWIPGDDPWESLYQDAVRDQKDQDLILKKLLQDLLNQEQGSASREETEKYPLINMPVPVYHGRRS